MRGLDAGTAAELVASQFHFHGEWLEAIAGYQAAARIVRAGEYSDVREPWARRLENKARDIRATAIAYGHLPADTPEFAF